MDTRKIIAELRAERDRIDRAIAAIETIASDSSQLFRKRQGKALPGIRRRRRMSAAGRKRLSEMMKQRWAERRKKARAA